MVFNAILTGLAKQSEITVSVLESDSKRFLPKLNFMQFLNHNVQILGRRLYSPSFKDLAWLEGNKLIFYYFPYICL